SSSGTFKVVSAADGPEVFSAGGLFDNGLFQQMAFSPDGRLIITASDGQTGGVLVWEVATRSLVRRYSTGFGTVYRLGVFPDGKQVASAGAEEVSTVWDITGRHGKGEPRTDELMAAWADLDATEGSKGYPALLTLVAGGTRGLRVITTGLEEMLETQQKVAKWVKDLGSEEFADREAASKELLALGIRALPAVQTAAAKAESAEVRLRAGDLMEKFGARGLRIPDDGMAGDTLRLFRAVQVLEEVGGADAKALLTRIATVSGPAGDAAKAALKRLGKK